MANDELDAIFHALADATRRGILQRVAEGNPSVAELGQPFAMSGPAISKHLKVLERAGLVTRVKEGKVNRFRLNVDPFEQVEAFVREMPKAWLGRSDAAEPEGPASTEGVEDDEMWKY